MLQLLDKIDTQCMEMNMYRHFIFRKSHKLFSFPFLNILQVV